jgi:putative hydrolases of HD superfamily
MVSLMQDYETRATPEGELARDADLLECLFQAREYQVQGYPDVEDWITNCYAGLQSPSAKRLADACLLTKPSEWWQGLKALANK